MKRLLEDAALAPEQRDASAFAQRLHDEIDRQRRRVHSFQQLCRRLAGAFPHDVANAHPESLKAWSEIETLDDFDRSPFDVQAPEPHPADFDWRFDGPTAKKLASLSSRHGSVLCLGTPTVYDAISRTGGEAVLIDRNPLFQHYLKVSARSRVVIEDIAELLPDDPRFKEKFGAAVLDPPWYLSDYAVWLARAISFVHRGGAIFLVVFRELTRSTGSKERGQLLKWLSSIGPVRCVAEAVYVTPRFESEVLARLALPQMPRWRAADIFRIDIHSSLTFRADIHSVRIPKRWHRFLVGKQTVALRPSHDDGPFSYSPPRPGASFELNSVSGRDPRRDAISIWTSRNRAATITGSDKVAAALESGCTSGPMGDRERLLARSLAADLGLQGPR